MTSVRSSFVGHAAKPGPGRIVGLEAAVHRQAAPVGVVAGLELRLLVVLLGVDRVGDERVAAVGADDHAGVLGDGLAALAVAADAGDAAVLDDELSTVKPSRTSAPASEAASTSSLSSTVRRGA